jgi:ribosome-associated translation inhibitor RaiA
LYRTEYETSDLYSAIDITKDEMIDVLSKSKDKRENLFRKGARMIKKLLRGE